MRSNQRRIAFNSDLPYFMRERESQARGMEAFAAKNLDVRYFLFFFLFFLVPLSRLLLCTYVELSSALQLELDPFSFYDCPIPKEVLLQVLHLFAMMDNCG